MKLKVTLFPFLLVFVEFVVSYLLSSNFLCSSEQ